MYLHLGGDTVVDSESIIGIFDLDNATLSVKTRELLSRAQKEGRIVYVSYDLPRSFVVCMERNGYIIYICQLSSLTLLKRATEVSGIPGFTALKGNGA